VSNAFIPGAVGTLILVISCSLTAFLFLDTSALVPAAELTQSRSMGETKRHLPWKAPYRQYLHDDLFISLAHLSGRRKCRKNVETESEGSQTIAFPVWRDGLTTACLSAIEHT
jgi:hypothetical protein